MKAIQINENKNYGFKEIKATYLKNLYRGLIYAVIFHIVVIGSYFISGLADGSNVSDNYTHRKPFDFIIPEDDKKDDVKKDDVIKTDNSESFVKNIKDLASLDPVAIRKDLSDNMITKTQDELNNVGNNVGREGDSTGQYSDNSGRNDNGNITKDIIEDKINKLPKDDDRNFNSSEVEVLPECVNLSQVRTMMKYPELAREIGTEGKVTVKVLVGQDGSVIKVGKLTGPEIFYSEVKDKASELKFKAGLQNNHPVKVWVTVPFNFKLQ